MSLSPAEIEKRKRAPAMPGVNESILRRWSPRAYSDRQPAGEDLRKIFEAARWAASSFNEQPWRFLVGRKGTPTYDRILALLTGWNPQWAASAPVLILSFARKNFTQNDHPNDYYLYDTGAATAYLALQATDLGMHAHSMAGFDKARAREAFAIPSAYDLGAVTALGYLGDPDTLPEAMKQMELAPRERRPLSEIVLSEVETPFAF